MTSRRSTPDLLAATWTEQERELLSVARQEQIPSYLEARMREALDLPLGDAAGSGAQDGSMQHGHSRTLGQLASTAPKQSLRVTQLFGSKLSLWGVLSILALGGFAYLGLHGSARSEQAGEVMPLTPSADRVTAPASTAPQLAPQAAALPEQLESNGLGRSALAESPAHAVIGSSAAKRERMHAAPSDIGHAVFEPGARAAATQSGSARIRNSPVEAVVTQRTAAAQSGSARAQNAPVEVAVAASSGSDPSVRAASSAAGSDVDELRLEAELLDGARRALGRGALQQARQQLDRYAARFEHGTLLPESEVLGIELEMRSGFQSAAQSHAKRFVSRYPNHPLCERVRELTAARRVTAAE